METENKSKKRPVGRPRVKIDWQLAERLAHIHCTKIEICAVLQISECSIDRAVVREKLAENFEDWYKMHCGKGKASLRRMQFKIAEDGSAAMAIWLGKQILGQKDKIEVNGQTQNFLHFNYKLREKP